MFAAVEGGLAPRALDEHPVPWTSTRGSEDLIAKRTQTRRRRGESISQKHQRMLPPRTLARSTTSCLHVVALRGFWTADHVVKTLELRLGFCLRGPASNGGGLRGASALCGFGVGQGWNAGILFGGRGGGDEFVCLQRSRVD